MSSAHNEYDQSDDDEEEDVDQLIQHHSKTPALLGFVDGPITEDDQPTIEDSFVGGKPVWFNNNSPPPAELLLCKVCNSPMALLSQSFAPLDDTVYDRVLYIFACKNTSCRRKKGSIRAIRAIHKDPVKMKQVQLERDQLMLKDLDSKLKLDQQKKLELELTKDLFLPSKDTNNEKDSKASNPFAANSSGANPFAASANPFLKPGPSLDAKPKESETKKTTFASVALKSSEKDQQKPLDPVKDTVKLKQFPGYFVYVDEESFKKKKKDDFKMTSKIEELDQSVLDTEFEESESSTKAKVSANPDLQQVASALDDPVFGNFSNIISYNSQQVFRYDLDGSPILYSSKDDIYKIFVNKDHELKVPNPGYNPSSRRRFELQLMPKLILDLESDNTDIMNGMEWGTIIVCTDVEDFVPQLDSNNVGYVEEWCGVQWEEEIKR